MLGPALAQAPASADGAPEPSASGESVSDAKGDAKGEKAAGETEASEAKTPSEEADGKKADGGEDQATTADAAETEAAKDVEAAIELLPPEMRELGREIESFEAEIRDYRGDVRRLIDHQYQRRRRQIKSRYSQVLDELTEAERARRLAAIEQFEAFLEKYPRNPDYTPDALFRLAELHFEKANDAYVTAVEEFDALMIAFDEGKIDQQPDQPTQDYARPIELFEELINRWPGYRNLDGAYYLKGYCLLEMGRENTALDAFTSLVQRFPKSRFAAETWTRIGEFYFDDNKLPEAIAAYARVLDYPKSPYYDEALYKLAWTYYRNDQYTQAIRRFRELIEFSDDRKKRTGQAGSELRSEAILYLAISLQEEDWDGDGEPDPDSGFQRVLRNVQGDRSYDVEILRALAGIFFDNAKYDETVATIRHLLKTFPTNEENPKLHAQMVTAYERLQRIEDAFAERDNLASAYGEGTEWYAANQNRPKVLRQADELMEDALIQAATFHHAEAQRLKERIAEDPSVEEKAISLYRQAASAYEKYLEQYPNSENTYDLNFFYAECLYYSFQFASAAEQYGVVRDSTMGKKYRENAAFSSILAHEKTIRGMINEGKLEPRASLLDADVKAVESTQVAEEEAGDIKDVPKLDIPEQVGKLIDARMKYVDGGLKNPDDPTRLPTIAYKLGEVYFDFNHYEEARKWFQWLIQRFPKEDVTKYAAGNIIESYRRTNDWRKMAEWAEIIAAAGLGREFDEEIKTLKVGALFKEAERLFQEKDYEKAAVEYIRLVTENPGNKYADAALNNAAVAYEETRRFESATKTYERIYTTYPKSQYAENALFRVGLNSERFYDYDKAIRSHMGLVEQYPGSEHRADSLFKAALLLERTQDYSAAAREYERYATLFPERKDTAETYFRAGKMYAKLGDTRNEIRVYERFNKTFGLDPKQNGRVIEGLARIAKIYKEAGRTRNVKRAYQRIINEFNSRGMPPGSYESQYPAWAEFHLVEFEFEKYRNTKIKGSLKNQGKVIKKLQKRLPELRTRYAEVLKYKSLEWTLAALYRVGGLFEVFAGALYDAPIPESFSDEMQDMYQTQLEDLALPLEDEAVKEYERAYAKAREERVTNDWTKRIVQSLNKFKPSEYPLFKEEKRVSALRHLTPPRLLIPAAPETEEPDAAPGDSTPEVEDAPSAEQGTTIKISPAEAAAATAEPAGERTPKAVPPEGAPADEDAPPETP